ncbi:MAG: ATP synthase F0 subunit B [Gemmatimonadales bacterium]|nr:MAG: ATP synthase F0 subunit B [Gemmatimonadales bacterium]
MKIPAMATVGLAFTPASLLAAQEGGGGLFTVDPGLSVWTIATFLVVLFVLGKFAWGPILGALDAREKGIKDSIDAATQLRQEAKESLEEHRRQLADARRQAQEIVAEGRSAADRLRRDIEEKAREEAERILERTRQEIRRERDVAIEQIRTEAVDLALAAAARILDEKLTEERDRALVKSYLQDIAAPRAEA